jgi:hypothetical protein
MERVRFIFTWGGSKVNLDSAVGGKSETVLRLVE